MDLFSQKVELSELKKGDHVYTWRKQVLFTHHGIFIGEGKIINFVQKKKKNRILTSSSSSSGGGEKTPCPVSYCTSEKVPGSGVRMSCIDCFVKKGFLYRYKYNASRKFLIAKGRGGTCTMALSDPQQEVMHRATYLYKNGYGKYDWMNNNCEDFALYCKTGLWSTNKEYQGRSSQANMLDGSMDVMIEELERGVTKGGSLIPRLAMAVPRSILKREKNDLGNRDDVVKVDVENLSSHISALKNK